ncbi:phage tail length tape measure family protein [Stenotrophomonas sp. RAC2]|uniref:phage tail length tape measure family protein n=2 Tax=unclassified Stenotrophomonas TaxID=196198 RepID=UPI0027202B16|nr:phage tail length tape measure family protein [Stenotrophomonas sp. RAC2]MDV9040959.1 phage tail tape measure C-terminal domain-containing protein [Stenotrophomonas sp. RAC2]
MSRSLGTLTIDVIAEVGGFASGLDKSERRAEKWRKKVEAEARMAGAALAAGVAVGVAALSAVAVKFGRNSIAAEKEVAQLDAIIRSTGGAAGYTRQQLLDMADTLADKSTFSGGEIVEAQTRLLSYSGILSSNIPRAMQAVIDQSARLGISVSQSAETIGRALESPSKAAAALAQQGFGAAFTKEVRGTIDELVKAGKEGEAQVMILEILEESYAGAALAARDTFGGALTALGHTLDDITTAKDGSLKGATAAVNDLIDTLKDPKVKEGFDSIVTLVANLSSELANGVVQISGFITKVRDLANLDAGGSVQDAGEAALNEQMARLNGLINYAKQNKTGLLGIPLTDSQEAARLKQINDLTQQRIGIQRELTERYKYQRAAEAFKGVTGSVDSTAKSSDSAAREAAAAAAADAENAKKRLATQKQLQQAYNTELLKYQRLAAVTNTESGKLSLTTKEQEAIFDTTKGALKGLNDEHKRTLVEAAKAADEVFALKRANEEEAKSTEFSANLKKQLRNAQDTLDVDFVGAGAGEEARRRARDLLSIQRDYQSKRDDLLAQMQAADISEELYSKETQALESALAERLRMQEEYYRKTDEQRDNWRDRMSDAWANYASDASDYNKQAYEATTGFLDSTTGAVAQSIADLVKGNESLFDSVKNLAVSMGETVINTLAQMAAQWLVYQGVQLLVGKSTAGAGAAGLVGNAIATQAQASLAAFASTAAIPIVGPALAPAAASAAMAATAPMVAMVTAGSIAGMAHDGIENVPETGTWLLQKGERVTTAATSAKLDATLDRVSRDSGGGGRGDSFEMHFNVNGSISERERLMQEQTVRRAVTLARQDRVADTTSGTGPQSRAMRSNWNVRRKVG